VTRPDADLGSSPVDRSADRFDDGAGDDGAGDEDELDDDQRRGPGTALWITLVIAALVLGGAIGWRATKSSDATERPAHDSVDVGFFQDMATHHNQAVAMGFSYLEHGADPLLRQIATEIINYQNAEIGMMNDHLAQWGQQGSEGSTAMAWMGMTVPIDEMPGLATAAQMQQLANARGRDLDDLFTRLMILHHEGGVHMAEYAATHATTETVRSWAAALAEGQRGEIAELNRWRVAHGLPAVKMTLIS
jgi:uncharacterized protein (DUF305 family)